MVRLLLLVAAAAAVMLCSGAAAAPPPKPDPHCLPTHCDCHCKTKKCCAKCVIDPGTKQLVCAKCAVGWVKKPGGVCARPPPPHPKPHPPPRSHPRPPPKRPPPKPAVLPKHPPPKPVVVPKRPPPPAPCGAQLGQVCSVGPDCCSGSCSSSQCCQDNVVSTGDLKSFDFSSLVKLNLQKCSKDDDCCDKHCVGVGPVKGCLPCVPVPLGACQTSDDCCFGANCQNQKCCRPNGFPCTPMVNITLPINPGVLCCSGVCDLTTMGCTDCVVNGNGCNSDSDCCSTNGDQQQCQAGTCCFASGNDCFAGDDASCCSGQCNNGKCA